MSQDLTPPWAVLRWLLEGPLTCRKHLGTETAPPASSTGPRTCGLPGRPPCLRRHVGNPFANRGDMQPKACLEAPKLTSSPVWQQDSNAMSPCDFWEGCSRQRKLGTEKGTGGRETLGVKESGQEEAGGNFSP